jgi:uncharacterized protein GlcG (DUF336 family)
VNIITMGLLILLATATWAEEKLTITTPQLQFAIATKAAVAAVSECSNRGYKVSAAVIGRDGNLLAFSRHPLAGPHTIATSQEKAYTAATLQTSTSVQLQKDRPDLNFAPGILLIQGGQAISVSGQFYGGIAVAGADTQTDEDCAKHGLSIISSALEFAE